MTVVESDTETPTMEEILESIKKTINEDTGNNSSDDDVLELTNPIQEVEEAKASNLLNKIDKVLEAEQVQVKQKSSVKTSSATGKVKTPEPQERTEAVHKVSTGQAQKPSSGWISDESAQKSSHALKELKEKINAVPSISNKKEVATGVTLEDLVKQALKPCLSAWLDKNLPPLVEKVVREEIQKLTSA